MASSVDQNEPLFATISAPEPVQEETDPCKPSPCGSNAVCRARERAAGCSCLPDYFGDPYVGCRPGIPNKELDD